MNSSARSAKEVLRRGVVAVVGLGALTAGATSCQVTPDKQAVIHDRAEDPRLTGQIALVEAADELRHLANTNGLRQRFVGVEIDHARNGVIIYWYGAHDINAPVMREAIENLEPEIGVSVVQAAERPEALHAEARRIMGLEPGSINGVRVTGAGPNDRYDGLIVSVHPADVGLAPGSIKSRFDLHFEAMLPAQSLASQSDR